MKNAARFPKFSSVVLPLAALVLGACSPENPKLMAPPEKYLTVEAKGGDFNVEFNPQVDILFVIDNSASMKDDQDRLAANIDKFVGAFAQNEMIDFHIGIVSVFDSVRQKEGVPNFYPQGQLRPLVSKTGEKSAGPGFITRQTPEWLETLKASLKLGVQSLDEGGPEYEELFSPVAAALSEQMVRGANKGFYRPNAHLAVIIISDANASNTEIEASELDYFLRTLKGNRRNMISAHGVISPVGSSCSTDPSGPAYKTQEFLSLMQGNILSLCEPNYGSKLAEIGQDIRRRTVGRTITLSGVPEFNTIEVKYGSQVIPQDAMKGWTYDPTTVSIVISGDVDVKPESGAQISVRFTPVNLNNLSNGRAYRKN